VPGLRPAALQLDGGHQAAGDLPSCPCIPVRHSNPKLSYEHRILAAFKKCVMFAACEWPAYMSVWGTVMQDVQDGQALQAYIESLDTEMGRVKFSLPVRSFNQTLEDLLAEGRSTSESEDGTAPVEVPSALLCNSSSLKHCGNLWKFGSRWDARLASLQAAHVQLVCRRLTACQRRWRCAGSCCSVGPSLKRSQAGSWRGEPLLLKSRCTLSAAWQQGQPVQCNKVTCVR